MLTELLAKEIEENFDKNRTEVEVLFDYMPCRYVITNISALKEVMEEAKYSTHAKIHIRDNTQSYIYNYDAESDVLTRSNEVPDKYYRPLLESDKWYEEKDLEYKESERKLNKNLLQAFLVCSFLFILTVMASFLYSYNTNNYLYTFYALSTGMLCEAALLLSISLRKMFFLKSGI